MENHAVIETCERGHNFAKLPDHPQKKGESRCPHCMAQVLDESDSQVDLNTLETWAGFAADAIQQVIDDCHESQPEEAPENVCKDLHKLLSDLENILKGDTYLMPKMARFIGDVDSTLILD
ncbi:hypothetical protein P886_3806 [Alteromonadaceae bacterium 2753L.S.0a.02]|nr:hypothetical protein P886_3806 [Alteromonadaceae bacterium 2753L.S.0a.02]